MNNNEDYEKLEKQVGTLKFVVLIMAAALIYNSAIKTGMLGEYKITASTIAAQTILLKGNNNTNLGKISVDKDNKISITLSSEKNQIIIDPSKIELIEINDSIDSVILKIPRN
ncbi:MAG: hypothetical protein HN613_01390 [Gammaproteobacteria bacterium]|jgi:hypothetical protein|nr:hypothetical protein [Gammaproteobacteria bacterium]MBT7603181.1 hypothetical protein [Gammaproteobacteria bacterium]